MRNRMSLSLAPRFQSLFLVSVLAALGTAQAQPLTGESLARALRNGGYVLVMRHASSPRTPPDAANANADNVQHERQLDDQGRASARAMGESMRHLQIPIGQVLSSPTYRALETVRLAQLGQPKTYSQLGDGGQSMQADPTGTRATWLREKVAQPPMTGTNTIIVTHFPNVNEAFAKDAVGLADGEALVFRPDGHGGALDVGRIKIEEWSQLAAQQRP
jgi:phosphohistidine phosphatase SixA